MLHAADARSVFIATASSVLHQTAISMNKYQQQCISFQGSRVAQWERAGPITQRSMDRNHPLLRFFYQAIYTLPQHTPPTHCVQLTWIVLYVDKTCATACVFGTSCTKPATYRYKLHHASHTYTSSLYLNYHNTCTLHQGLLHKKPAIDTSFTLLFPLSYIPQYINQGLMITTSSGGLGGNSRTATLLL